ncbi:MAG: ABC transporter permease [Caldilineaceae bacterium]|nr:ABC transporter permease [Caldilineaceae bacterium]
MQSQISGQIGDTFNTSPAGAVQSTWGELWRGAWVIFNKHMLKFRTNSMEIGGTLGWPLLWIGTFGLGMERVVDTSMLGGTTGSYLAFITPGIIALTALSGAVNSGMTLLEEKIRGVLKEYFVAPIPRMSILLASTGSGLVKTLIQSIIILAIAVLFGARMTWNPIALLGGLIFLLLYVMAFVGFSNGVAARSNSVGGYHMLLFVLNLPLLFLSNALYPLDVMPGWMRVLAYLNPTTYVVDGLRHTLFNGGSLPVLLSLTVLTLFAAVCNWYGLRSFQAILESK